MPTYRCEVLQDNPEQEPNVYHITAPGQAIAILMAFALDGGMTCNQPHPSITGIDADYVGTQEKPVDYAEHLALARQYTKAELIGSP